MVIPPIILIGAEVLVCALAVIYSRKDQAGVPYTIMLCYIVVTDLIRWGLLLLLPRWEVVLFPLVDLIWISHFGSYVWMARRMVGKEKSKIANIAVITHGAATALISGDYVLHRERNWFAFRVKWVRVSSFVLLWLAFKDLITVVYKKNRDLDTGLGLALVSVDMFQILNYRSDKFFVAYQVAFLCYMVVGSFFLVRSIYKERFSHA